MKGGQSILAGNHDRIRTVRRGGSKTHPYCNAVTLAGKCAHVVKGIGNKRARRELRVHVNQARRRLTATVPSRPDISSHSEAGNGATNACPGVGMLCTIKSAALSLVSMSA